MERKFGLQWVVVCANNESGKRQIKCVKVLSELASFCLIHIIFKYNMKFYIPLYNSFSYQILCPCKSRICFSLCSNDKIFLNVGYWFVLNERLQNVILLPPA